MTNEQVSAAIARLKRHAVDLGDIPPERIIADDGSPSSDLMAYCDRHMLTLDWVLLGKRPSSRTTFNHSERPPA